MTTDVRPTARIAALLAFALVAMSAATAAASPWTLPKDQLALDLSYDFQHADSEYLPDGKHQIFPLDGTFTSSRLTLGARYGFTSRVEGAVKLTFKQVSYESLPFLKGDPTTLDSRGAVYDESVLNFSETRIGAGDFRFLGRYNFFDSNGVIKLTSETELKLPAGYEEPSGTFANDKPAPSNIQDDVTLGDGQVDLTERILFGAYVVPTRTFARAGVGYSLRFGPPGDQLLGSIKIGQNLGENVILFTGMNIDYTVTEGESIGKSFVTYQPEKSAKQLNGSLIEQIDLSLDKDYLQVRGGVIFRIQKTELQFAYSRIVWGRNIPAIQTATVSTVFAVPDVTGNAAATASNGE